MPITVPFLQLGTAVAELRPQIDTAIHRVLDSGWYLLGPELEGMEKEWASWCGAAHTIGVGLDDQVTRTRTIGAEGKQTDLATRTGTRNPRGRCAITKQGRGTDRQGRSPSSTGPT